MVDFSEQKATFSPIKRPHGLILMDTHLVGAVSTLGHVCGH